MARVRQAEGVVETRNVYVCAIGWSGRHGMKRGDLRQAGAGRRSAAAVAPALAPAYRSGTGR